MTGLERGGRVTTVTGVPSQPNTFYMGSTGGGVWKTTVGQASWPVSWPAWKDCANLNLDHAEYGRSPHRLSGPEGPGGGRRQPAVSLRRQYHACRPTSGPRGRTLFHAGGMGTGGFRPAFVSRGV